MTILKTTLFHLPYGSNRVQGFTLLPVKFETAWRPRVTSPQSRDNIHRFKKEFLYMLPYGMAVDSKRESTYWRFYPPKRWLINFGNAWVDAEFLRAENIDHYATVKGRFLGAMKKYGKMKIGKTNDVG